MTGTEYRFYLSGLVIKCWEYWKFKKNVLLERIKVDVFKCGNVFLSETAKFVGF
jgi:hypothetical protein